MTRILSAIWLLVFSSLTFAQHAETFYYMFPSWSPDGRKLAFEGGLEGKTNIYTIDVNGENLRQLTDEKYNDERPVWSPDGTKIAFFSNRSDKRNLQPVSLQIYTMNSDGTDQRRITHEGPALEFNPSWSPDGKQLAFQSRPEINPGVHSLYVIGADGTGRARMTDGAHNDTDPQWSPDGSKLLFIQSDAIYQFYQDITPEQRTRKRTSFEVAIFNLNDRSTQLITRNELRELDPSWSADGMSVLYLQENGADRKLMTQNMDTRAARPLVDTKAVYNTGALTRTRMSPDGKQLVYHRETEGVWGIYTYNLARGQEYLVVGGPGLSAMPSANDE